MKIKKLLGKQGFTLVEIMIVVAIIGLLAAVAIPNFLKAREKAQENACIANLKQIDGAKTLWGLDGHTGTATWNDLVPSYIKKQPTCAAGSGAYVIGSYTTDPACPNVASYASHKLS
jgi:prepilin-type N-terminal cleavage/methylation domain-containing protein